MTDCVVCDAPLGVLGRLGPVLHLVCNQCGSFSSILASELDLCLLAEIDAAILDAQIFGEEIVYDHN